MKNLEANKRSRKNCARSEVPALRDSESLRISRLGYVAASQGAETVRRKNVSDWSERGRSRAGSGRRGESRAHLGRLSW